MNEPITKSVSSFFDALKTGASTALIGMCIVFSVLAVIFFALVAMRKILGKKPKQNTAPAESAIPVSEEAPEETPADDTAVVAAIIAAISAHTGKAPSAFRVVSFKRRR